MEVVNYYEKPEILRQVSEEVSKDEIKTEEFQKFLADLKQAMLNCPVEEGWVQVGISAIQVGIPKRVFIAYDNNREDYLYFINPQVEYKGDSQDDKLESCLSAGDARGIVRRYKRVKIKYLDENGKKQQKKYSGWNARVIQHEYDHLDGIMFMDKVIEE